ncbi:MAG: ribonuclease E activity regulator RraA [Gammaproteobacteria bacterium]|nr:ribonuclease E activity regulator RraA [Gammaproteobacteria bacterium]
MIISTADLYDAHESEVLVVLPGFVNYGGRRSFHGPITTIKVHEDNSLVRSALEKPGNGHVLVVDGGGSLRCALVGDKLAELGRDNGWAGVIVHGCIRDSAQIGRMDFGVQALGTNPRRSVKRGDGQRDIPVTFHGVTFAPGAFIYADDDGMLVGAANWL